MKLIITILSLSILFSCDRGEDFSLEFKSPKQGGVYLTTEEMQSRFTVEEKEKVSALCEALSSKKSQLNNTIKFETISKNCEGKVLEENVSVKNEDNGDHHYYNADKKFPFYQDQTITQGVIKDLCLQQTGQKVVAMSNHGGTVRYLFNFNKSCPKDHYCIEAGTIVQDYRNQKMKLVRNELFQVNAKGIIVQRELVHLCKDEKTPFHYKAKLK